jgi:ABC-type sugar transport system ATPase subunit
MIELRNIHKSFGDVRVLGGVNLRLEKGFVYTLKGGNGSGKTILVNIISLNAVVALKFLRR